MKSSKRYKDSEKLAGKDKSFSVETAVDALKSMPVAKFDETLEFSCQLSVDPKQSDQMVRGSIVLPNGIGKKVKVLVFCEPDQENEAKEAGADYIGSSEIIDKIVKEGWFEFDYCIATPSMMKEVSKMGRVLGPRGLMPSPKTGSVTPNVTLAIKEAKRGKIDFRMDKFGCIHAGLGKLSFTKDALIENINAFIGALNAAKPPSAKGDLMRNIFLSSTMGPSVKVLL
ncbi:MAG: 50S ribosomal protein L1 [Candidatus Omnitrophica bacterium]|nr:50S ribosomal protein L1 [Candidatus Omnitrophota bacterium]